MLADHLEPLPLIPILRGLTPGEAVAIGRAIVAEGYGILEVPLNSPEPLASIRALAAALGPAVLVGAGTVREPADVARIAAAGGRLIVMPHADPAVIGTAKAAGLACVPGVATPSEAFAALAAGADALKLFPAELVTPPVVKAIRAVLPAAVRLFPVGGITPEGMAAYVRAGANGFGIGGAIYRPGTTPAAAGEAARAFAQAWRALSSPAAPG
jgi:2-dehydro-3-deoxyphosphogalactonate aldolase